MFKDYIDYIKDNPQGYWFRAKIFGWGWTPAKWQGWITMLVFFLLILGNAYRLGLFENTNQDAPIGFLFQTVALVLILLAICYKTGEKPRWQWGIPKKKSGEE